MDFSALLNKHLRFQPGAKSTHWIQIAEPVHMVQWIKKKNLKKSAKGCIWSRGKKKEKR